MKEINNSVIVAVSIVAAALIVAVAFNAGGISEKNNLSQGNHADIPAYLSESTSVQNYGNDALSEPASNDVISFAADNTNTRLLSVSGQATKKVSPDKAIIVLSVETTDNDAKTSQQKNAELASKVMNALKSAGIAESDIKTFSYKFIEDI